MLGIQKGIQKTLAWMKGNYEEKNNSQRQGNSQARKRQGESHRPALS
jgi:hypothetical protein